MANSKIPDEDATDDEESAQSSFDEEEDEHFVPVAAAPKPRKVATARTVEKPGKDEAQKPAATKPVRAPKEDTATEKADKGVTHSRKPVPRKPSTTAAQKADEVVVKPSRKPSTTAAQTAEGIVKPGKKKTVAEKPDAIFANNGKPADKKKVTAAKPADEAVATEGIPVVKKGKVVKKAEKPRKYAEQEKAVPEKAVPTSTKAVPPKKTKKADKDADLIAPNGVRNSFRTIRESISDMDAAVHEGSQVVEEELDRIKKWFRDQDSKKRKCDGDDGADASVRPLKKPTGPGMGGPTTTNPVSLKNGNRIKPVTGTTTVKPPRKDSNKPQRPVPEGPSKPPVNHKPKVAVATKPRSGKPENEKLDSIDHGTGTGKPPPKPISVIAPAPPEQPTQIAPRPKRRGMPEPTMERRHSARNQVKEQGAPGYGKPDMRNVDHDDPSTFCWACWQGPWPERPQLPPALGNFNDYLFPCKNGDCPRYSHHHRDCARLSGGRARRDLDTKDEGTYECGICRGEVSPWEKPGGEKYGEEPPPGKDGKNDNDDDGDGAPSKDGGASKMKTKPPTGKPKPPSTQATERRQGGSRDEGAKDEEVTTSVKPPTGTGHPTKIKKIATTVTTTRVTTGMQHVAKDPKDKPRVVSQKPRDVTKPKDGTRKASVAKPPAVTEEEIIDISSEKSSSDEYDSEREMCYSSEVDMPDADQEDDLRPQSAADRIEQDTFWPDAENAALERVPTPSASPPRARQPSSQIVIPRKRNSEDEDGASRPVRLKKPKNAKGDDNPASNTIGCKNEDTKVTTNGRKPSPSLPRTINNDFDGLSAIADKVEKDQEENARKRREEEEAKKLLEVKKHEEEKDRKRKTREERMTRVVGAGVSAEASTGVAVKDGQGGNDTGGEKNRAMKGASKTSTRDKSDPLKRYSYEHRQMRVYESVNSDIGLREAQEQEKRRLKAEKKKAEKEEAKEKAKKEMGEAVKAKAESWLSSGKT